MMLDEIMMTVTRGSPIVGFIGKLTVPGSGERFYWHTVPGQDVIYLEHRNTVMGGYAGAKNLRRAVLGLARAHDPVSRVAWVPRSKS